MYNVADFEALIRSYISNQMKIKFPNLDTSSNSFFDDLYIKPTIENMIPFLNNANTVDILMDLSNADQLSEADLDSIGENNYGLARNAGVKATTILSIAYTLVSSVDDTIIPSGVVFKDSTGLQFQTTQKYVFSPSEMQSKYNPTSLLYIVDIPVTATNAGIEYNLAANQITIFPTSLSSFIDHVTNEAAVTNGKSRETNLEYAKRISTYYVSRYLGTIPGYRNDILSVATGITDVLVVGKDDPSMTRDTITVVDGETTKTIHIGGKTDIYLKGSQYDQRSATMPIYSGKLKLSKPYSKINLTTLSVINVSQPSITVQYVVQDQSDVAYVVITNTGGSSYSLTELDNISVLYKTTDSPAIDISDSFQCGLSAINLEIPFHSIVSVVDANDPTITYVDSVDYNIIRTDPNGNIATYDSIYYGSTQESVVLKFNDNNTIENLSNILCTYTVNSSAAQLSDHYDVLENRITTVDLLIKEASHHYVNIGFEVKLKDGQILDDVRKIQIQGAVIDYISGLGIGESLKESDIVSSVYANDTIMSYLYYIKLPFLALYSPTNTTDPITPIHEASSYIEAGPTEYIVLNKIEITEVI